MSMGSGDEGDSDALSLVGAEGLVLEEHAGVSDITACSGFEGRLHHHGRGDLLSRHPMGRRVRPIHAGGGDYCDRDGGRDDVQGDEGMMDGKGIPFSMDGRLSSLSVCLVSLSFPLSERQGCSDISRAGQRAHRAWGTR